MGKWTIKDVYDYLDNQYVLIETLSVQSGLPVRTLDEMIDAQCIPGPSYEIYSTTEIDAFSNDRPTQLTRQIVSRHFSPFILSWIERAKSLMAGRSLKEVAGQLKAEFREEYRRAVVDNGGREFNYKKLFNPDGSIDEQKFAPHFEDTFRHWCKGTWGICVIRSDSFDRIALKQIAAERLVQLTDNGQKMSFSAAEEAAFRQAVIWYNEIVLEFSRHDHEDSSRWRLIENVLPRMASRAKIESAA